MIKGCHHSEETKRKMSLKRRGDKHWNWKGGRPRCLDCGKSLSLYKVKRCVPCNKKYQLGEHSPCWKGGVTLSKSYRKKQGILYRSKRKDYLRLKQKEYRKKNYLRILYLNERRRIRKMGNGGYHTLVEWETLKAQYNWTCLACKRQEPEIKLTEDHIIPLIKGGSDNIENIQPLCKSCNCKKHTDIINYYNLFTYA